MQLSAVSTYLRQLNGNITYRCSRTQYPFNFVRIFIRILMVPRYNTLFDIAVGCSRECWHHEILIYLFYFFRNNFCFPIFVWLLNGIALKRNMFTFSQWSKRSNCKWTKNTIKRKLTIGCNTVFVAKVFHESARDCVCVCVTFDSQWVRSGLCSRWYSEWKFRICNHYFCAPLLLRFGFILNIRKEVSSN